MPLISILRLKVPIEQYKRKSSVVYLNIFKYTFTWYCYCLLYMELSNPSQTIEGSLPKQFLNRNFCYPPYPMVEN